jgi:hypothetical protein
VTKDGNMKEIGKEYGKRRVGEKSTKGIKKRKTRG